LNYQSCRIIPLSSTAQLACDCQKQTPEATTGDKQHNTENATFKPRPEEVFMTANLFTPGYFALRLLSGSADRSAMIPSGCTAPVFQPPRPGNAFSPLFI
jgi:hypothetical protein